MSLSLATYRLRLLAVRDAILAGGGGSVLYFGGTIVDHPEDTPGSAPLATLPLDLAAFALHASDAALAVHTIGNASTSGVTTWVRFANGGGVGVLDLTAGPPGSDAQVILTDGEDPPTTRVWTGGEITFDYTLTDP